MSDMRKPIGIMSAGNDTKSYACVVCDDGSVWIRPIVSNVEVIDAKTKGWKELPPIPGSQRENRI